MLEKMKNNIDISEEKSIKNTNLYIRNVQINEESYETKMLLEENIENVLKFQIVYENEERALMFDVSNTISFEEYIKNHKLQKRDICEIIYAIDSILSSIENYLISENSVSLDLKLIRVVKNENKRNDLRFVVIPNYETTFSLELSKFLIRMLRSIDIEDKDALKLAYGLFVRSAKENYTINELIELVDIVKEKKKGITRLIDEESLNAYDDEMLSEMSDENEVIAEEYIEDIAKDEHSMDIVMDKNTKDLLEEKIFDDFDKGKEKEKIIKFKKKIFDIKPKKMLNAHIIVNVCRNAVVPVASIIIPLLFYLIYGTEKFMKYLPAICLYEIILLTIYVISNIMNSKNIENS